MDTQMLTKAGAFSPGSELWVLPELHQSKWTQQVDWYLNFIISRAHKHQPAELSETLKKIINDCDLPLEINKKRTQSPLLFSSQNRIPSKKAVILEYNDSMDEWIERIHIVWKNLNKPALRIFLATDLTVTEFKKLWPDKSDNHIELVANT